jgi:hypothetical protein
MWTHIRWRDYDSGYRYEEYCSRFSAHHMASKALTSNARPARSSEREQSGVVTRRAWPALLDRPGGDLPARCEAQLGEDIGDVCLDSPLADDQRIGDLAVDPTLCDQRGDLALAPGQTIVRIFSYAARDRSAWGRRLTCRAMAPCRLPVPYLVWLESSTGRGFSLEISRPC